MSGLLSDTTLSVLEKALDTAGLRQRISAHNIANVNTPGYKRSYVTFEEQLQQALGSRSGIKLARRSTTHLGPAGSVAEVAPEVKKDQSHSMKADGNNVDIDSEMAEVAMNSILYNAAATRLNSKLSMLRYVINEGRR